MNWVITKNKIKNHLSETTGDNAKMTKRLTEIPVLTKKFYQKNLKKKMKVTELFKPINYWDIAHKLIWSNLLNQINLIRYGAKFGTFLLDQIFWKSDVF